MKQILLVLAAFCSFGCGSNEQLVSNLVENNINEYYAKVEGLDGVADFYLGIRLAGMRGKTSVSEVDYLFYGNDTSLYFIRWSINGSSGSNKDASLGQIAQVLVDSLITNKGVFSNEELALNDYDSFDEFLFMKDGSKGRVCLRRGQIMSLPKIYSKVYRLILDAETVKYKWCD
jgi:hypothetical protein